MKLLLEDAMEVANGIWLTFAPPHQLTKLEHPKTTRGTTSVLIVSSPVYERDRSHLILEADSVVVLNVGTTPRTVVVDTIHNADVVLRRESEVTGQTGHLGPGDREFLALAEAELQDDALEAAVELILEIRFRWAGDLKRGERNNFSNTPDNFWYVIVQPRVQALSITVRGLPEKFRSNLFTLREDRPGFTRFQIKRRDEVAEALRLIEQSKRK